MPLASSRLHLSSPPFSSAWKARTPGSRQKRKSRGRGLRATTGCVICKRRHVKCDEVRPRCGPCAKGQRPCVYACQDASISRDSVDGSPRYTMPFPAPRNLVDQQQVHEPLQVLVDACHQEQPIHQKTSQQELDQSTDVVTESEPKVLTGSAVPAALSTPRPGYGYVPSPGTDNSAASTRIAPLSWFELLATDAANADDRFLLSPPQQFPQSRTDEPTEDPRNSSNLRPRTLRERESFYAAAFPRNLEIEQRLASHTPEGASTVSDDPLSWSTYTPIPLSNLEHLLFSHFIHVSSQWLDFYDPIKHFSSVVPHLALRNVGLMRALLALSARHLSLDAEQQHAAHTSLDTDGLSLLNHTEAPQHDKIDRNLAVQYYYETLHYLNRAMQHPSYARSLEVIATSLLISTYEMIDGSNQDWERHLKGVFWIQRFQDNDGESGGLRQAVWWAWLRQDVWVAMRERRRVFSFWQPKKPLAALTAPELATRATYLLAQCVNYISKEEQETSTLERRLERGSELLFLLQEWYDHLLPEFNALPLSSDIDTFPPIWVNPSSYAAALQVQSLARILVILHRPSTGGMEDYRAAQKLLTLSVNTICGLTRTIDEKDHAASLVAIHCLFGAGMCVHTPYERIALLELLDSCQRRVHWPLVSLRKELELEYAKDALPSYIT
ncbi:Zn(II)2Cys6 transcription factor [Penicillium argentinense]|uniref:Zn(II)2Cys6 transcription factor n=1 Tax=Penicillium argentinense TaxID=1131581 RepID=A0A9W9G3X7_9EURO|nr:Zn(II)2Cys6 transcription factor [Penicillium argentinense]KAJ5111604.1 Zn(II)2Cys6 transcription factor [Penicillium argentinense]